MEELILKDSNRDNGQYWYEKNGKKISVVDFGKFMSTAPEMVKNSGVFMKWEALTEDSTTIRANTWKELKAML